jgi:TusA-related sulfurtransferase
VEILEVEVKAEEAHKKIKEFHDQLNNAVRELNEYQRPLEWVVMIQLKQL